MAAVRRARPLADFYEQADVDAYLPDNYMCDVDMTVWGEDHAGWTLDGYVIPRLASALIFYEEVSS